MIVEFTSEQLATKIEPRDNWALISIVESERTIPESPYYNVPRWDRWRHSIVLGFHDIDVDKWPEYEAAWAEQCGYPAKCFNRDHARQIMEFIRSLPSDTEKIVVHCAGGVSRSAAVARFLSEEIYRCDCYRSFFPNKVDFKEYTSDNKWVEQVLREEYGEV